MTLDDQILAQWMQRAEAAEAECARLRADALAQMRELLEMLPFPPEPEWCRNQSAYYDGCTAYRHAIRAALASAPAQNAQGDANG